MFLQIQNWKEGRMEKGRTEKGRKENMKVSTVNTKDEALNA